MHITPESPVRFPTTIQGVACIILVTHYLPAEPSITSGPMEDAEEGIPAEFEFTIPIEGNSETPEVLSELLTDDELNRIFDEFEAYLLASKHDIIF